MTVLDRPTTQSINLRKMTAEQVAGLAEELAGRAVPGVRLTAKQFVDWAMFHVSAEWVDGRVVLMSPLNDVHDDLDTWLIAIVRQFIEVRSLGVIRHNMFIRLPRQRRLRVPDLMFIAEANLARIRPTFIQGPPDLVVEIVSIDSQNRDRREKYLEYEAAGVREYWIIDPLSRTLDVYALRGGAYEATQPQEGRYASTVLPGFHLRIKWLFGRRRPKVADVLTELGAA